MSYKRHPMHKEKSVLKKIKDAIEAFRFGLWLKFGGWRTLEIITDVRQMQAETNEALSKHILENRERIVKLQSSKKILEQSVWDLQDHTVQEGLDRIQTQLQEYENDVHRTTAEIAGISDAVSDSEETPTEPHELIYENLRAKILSDPESLDRMLDGIDADQLESLDEND